MSCLERKYARMNVCTPAGLGSLGTSLGLSQTTGYSPYMPLLALAIATKWFHLCQVNPAFGFIISDWFLVLIVILTIVDLIVDLIPGASSGWHAVHTAITPVLGGFVAAATTPAAGISLPGVKSGLPAVAAVGSISLTGTMAPFVMFVVGFVLAGLVHLHRFGGRAVANVGHVFTLGLSNVVISVFEDVLAVVGIVLSFLAPVVMLVVVGIVVGMMLVTFRYVRRGMRFLRGRM